MTEQIREQVSALLDGELPRDEMGLLLRRLDRDAELRRAFGSYALIGETLRAPGGQLASRTFATRVSAALDGDAAQGERNPRRAAEVAAVAVSPAVQFWRRPAVRTALAASAAAAAVVLFRPDSPQQSQPAALVAGTAPRMQLMVASPTPAQSQRMASYVMAHSQFSTPMVRRNVLTGLLAADPGITRVSFNEMGEAR